MKIKGVFLAAILAAVLCVSGNLLAYSGGDGSAENPYQIANVADFQQLSTTPGDWSKSFILTSDINLTGLTFTQAPIAPDTSSSSGFQGTQFTGVFDGNGHVISNLTHTSSTQDFVGLFGWVGSGGQIKNLGTENINITGDALVGGLVGENEGTLTACYAAGAVSGSQYVGGLVGGLHGSITSCYAVGSVDGLYEVGGLVGYNPSGTLTACYAAGAVSGSQIVGGLVGRNLHGSITACYAAGAVDGMGTVGGLVGYNGSSTIITGCFWDIQTSGQNGSAGGTGKTTLQMKTLSTFTDAGWDFINVWAIEQYQTIPYFRTRPSADLNHDGIVNLDDFMLFAAQWLEGI